MYLLIHICVVSMYRVPQKELCKSFGLNFYHFFTVSFLENKQFHLEHPVLSNWVVIGLFSV